MYIFIYSCSMEYQALVIQKIIMTTVIFFSCIILAPDASTAQFFIEKYSTD
jgi:hypothetical protein